MYEKRINQEEKVSMKIREVNEKKQRYFPFSLAIFTGNPKVGVGKCIEALYIAVKKWTLEVVKTTCEVFSPVEGEEAK